MRLLKAFGKNPSGKRLETIQKSRNYKNGIFENLSPTDMLATKVSMLSMTWRFFNKPKNTAPPKVLPSVKTDLKSISVDKPVIVWFGHSSYFIRINKTNILVDPVLSGHASPFSFGGNSFPGTDIYTVADLPDIDVLLLTHDHYDHLDHRTIHKLRNKVKNICCPLGVGSHLVYWGIDENIISEFDWWDRKQVADDIDLIAAPARHFSGRSLVRNKTLWSSFILKTAENKIYIGSDSGYDTHFTSIGEKYGPFDIAILETGQYNTDWPFIHMMPEEAVQATLDLNARILLPVHWGKFALAFHAWDEPVQRVITKAKEIGVAVTTPMIGEPVIIGNSYPDKQWWKLEP